MKIKKLLAVLILSLLSVFFVSCTKSKEKEKGNASVEYNFSVNSTSEVLEVGDTFQIISAYGDKTVTFSCEQSSVATVSQSGLVTAVGLGDAYIKMTVEGMELERFCKISVVEYQYTVEFITENNYPVCVNAERKLNVATYKDGVSYDANVFWSVDRTGATVVGNGAEAVFRASQAGVYTVTVRSAEGGEATFTITVVDGFIE